MKKPATIFAIFIMILSFTIVSAQEKKTPKTPEQRAKHRTEQMKTALSLSADQEKKFYAIALEHANSMENVKTTMGKDSDEARRKRIQEIHAKAEKEIEAMLTPEQNTKYQTEKRKKKEKREEKKSADK